MKATVGDHLSIQVEERAHQALQGGTAAIICAGAALGYTMHVHAVGAAVHTGAKVGVKLLLRLVQTLVQSLVHMLVVMLRYLVQNHFFS